jgi:RNA polymerase sigma-70 factor (ECF subfamily)
VIGSGAVELVAFRIRNEGVGLLKGLGRPSRQQDADALFLRALYAEHGQALLGYAVRLTGDRGRAEDIVQETFLRAWKHAGALNDDGRPLRPWLFTVTANLAADSKRSRRARPAEVSVELGREVAAPDELDHALQAWQLAAVIANLSTDHRAVLLELYYRGRTVQQTAQLLGIPAGTVKSRSFYALRALRLVLEEQGWNP